MSNKRPRTGEAETALAGFAGFGSFMQDKSVRQLISEPSAEYTDPLLTIAVDTDPLAHGFPAQGGDSFGKPQRANFLLGDEYFFVNHGAFGAVARPIFEAAQAWRRYAEVQPLKFIDRELLPLLVHTIREFAPEVGAAATDLVFIPSATVGLNTVINAAAREWSSGDDVLSLEIGYSSVRKMLDVRCAEAGARHVVVPVALPVASADDVMAALEKAIGPRTRFAVIDHVTSNTALVLPVARMVQLCRSRGVKVLIDGAHAPGMLDLDLTALDADWYVANLHKWYCCPRGCAFLWARPGEGQSALQPLVVSHGSSDGFTSAFVWDGNRDYSATLSVLTAVRVWRLWGGGKAREYMRRTAREAGEALVSAWGTSTLAPWDMFGSMVMVRVPSACAGITEEEEAYPAHAKFVQDTLFHTYQVEVPVKVAAGKLYVRISAHVYNHKVDYKAVASAISTMQNDNLGKVTVCTKGGGCA
jgi:selenocysteine lyase/cysteine desulfurase